MMRGTEMVSVHVLTQIAWAIAKYSDDVDAFEQDPNPEKTELNCLEGRGVFGKLFSDWREFLEFDPDSFRKFHEDLVRSVSVMNGPAAVSQDAAHAQGSTRCRQEAVRCLLEDKDPVSALAALDKMAEFSL